LTPEQQETISRPSGLSSRSKLNVLILGAILLSAVGFRLYELGSGLWLDEIITYVDYAVLPFKQIVTTYDSENQHFLYSLLAHTSLLVFGKSIWSLRLPAVILGVGSIWALYLLGRKVSSAREGLLSAALLAFSYHHLWFSQNARGYTGLLLWTLLSSWLLLKALDERDPRLWLLYAACAALGVYTHLTMVFVIAGQFLVYLIALVAERKQVWTGLLLGFCLAGLLTLLLHAPVLGQMAATIGGTEVSVVESWKNPLWTLRELAQGINIGLSSSIVGLGALLLFGAGLVSYARLDYRLVVLLLVPCVVGAAVTLAVGHHLWPRFFFFAFGFGVLILVRGAMSIGKWAGNVVRFSGDRSALLGTLLSIALILVSGASMVFAYGPKQDYEGALAFVDSTKRPGDQTVAVDIAAFVYDTFYHTNWPAIGSLDELNMVRSSADRTWLIYTFPPVLQARQPDIMATIGQHFAIVKEFPGTVREGTVFVTLYELAGSGLSPGKNEPSCTLAGRPR
jgi:mannosyltransferase